ncbi:pyridoxal phosphate-dependent aminotransferase [Candidatus Woesearchaeota archaeon]|nr:MAG: pyridoxal phosphate-dependent aminotransferase [Candidatus Woesearchaeota archaeon]
MKKEDLSPASFIGIQGNGYISFGSGQPDLPPPRAVYDILPTYRSFKYGLVQGQLNLRKALAKQYANATPDDFVITNGASEALDLTLRTLRRKGCTKVLLPRPYYYSYPHMVKFAGMEPVYTQLKEGLIDFDDFEEKIRGCGAVIINSPSNPTGRVESIETLKKIERLCKDLNITIISDEVYKDLIYTRENYLLSGPHVVTINSFSKTWAMCGFRVGYLWSSDREFIKQVIAMKSHTSMNTNILGQEMAFEATKVDRAVIKEQLKIWKARRDLI